MTAGLRAFVTGLATLGFMILVACKLQKRIDWSWWIVFIPMSIYHILVLVYASFFAYARYQHRHQNVEVIVATHEMRIFINTILCLVMQFTLCVKLDHPHLEIPTWSVLLPLWIMLAMFLIGAVWGLRDYFKYE